MSLLLRSMSGPRLLSFLLIVVIAGWLLPTRPALGQTDIVESAEQGLGVSRWTLSGTAVAPALTTEPAERLRIIAQGGQSSFMVKLGKLAFRSPLTLGGVARRLGLSCDTCHLGGAVNTGFFFAPVSDRPGNLDVSHKLWNPLGDDGLANPVNIPSLRGVRWTAPYGRDGRFTSLAGFTRNVIVGEFSGSEPDAIFLDALVSYQRELDFPLNSMLRADGRLTASAPNDARRGAVLFQRDCANCHIPSSSFTDGRNHDVGTNGYFDTPTLRGLRESAPYFHDGRAADLKSVVAHFVRTLELGYDATQRSDLVRFLEVIGTVDAAPVRITLVRDMARVQEFADLLRTPLEDENIPLAERIADMLRIELRRIHERFHQAEHEAQRAALVELSVDLGTLVDAARNGTFTTALQRLRQWRRQSEAAVDILKAGAATSLYDPCTLQAAVAESD